MMFFRKHPKGLFILFFTEMWERFSFYGMKTLLIFYLTKYHFFSDDVSNETIANYAGLVYALPIIGGAVADRYLGFKKSIVFGAILLVLGHLGMAYEGHQAYYAANGEIVRDNTAIQVFYFSLALIIMGVCYIKPNISSIVGSLYKPGDRNRDAGFTIFYMGINIGSASASLLCGWLGETYGWKYGFGLAGIGMIIGLITFLLGQKQLQGLGGPPEPEKLKEKPFLGIPREWGIYILSILGIFLVWQIVQDHHVVGSLLASTGGIFIVFIVWYMIKKASAVERARLFVLIIISFFSIVFWALFEQSFTSMNLFTDRIVDRRVFGNELNAGMFISLNAIFIVIFAPVMAALWMRLGKSRMEPNIPVKFAMGIMLAGLGFGSLVMGIKLIGTDGKVALIWLVLAYFFHTIGELALSPVGLSAVTKLSPSKIVGTMMGVWFLATAASEYIAPILAKLASVKTVAGEVADSAAAVNAYDQLFSGLLWVGLIAGVILLILSPFLKKHMHGIQ
ncbi:MAG: MFS transporter [Bacteroidetes bacterium]|nr:MFS transporter [Bacteroidota bacterium]